MSTSEVQGGLGRRALQPGQPSLGSSPPACYAMCMFGRARLWVVMALAGSACHTSGPTASDAGTEDGGLDAPSAYQCEGVPAPSDSFLATRDQCVLPEGVVGTGYVRVLSSSANWQARAFIYRAYPLDAYLAVRCGECEVRSAPQQCGADRLDDANAGDISVSTSGGGNATLAYLLRHPNVYGTASGDGPFFSGGETLTVSAPGGPDVSAFSRQLALPSTVTVVPPPASLRRGWDAEIRWAGGGVGYVEVRLEASFRRNVTCRFPANAGAGTIPGDLLRTFEPGELTLYITANNAERFTVGPWLLEVSAEAKLDAPDGGAGYAVPVHLED
jgi:hypothetical protein